MVSILTDMKTQVAVQHFGGVPALATALGITRTAIYLWGEDVPQGRAFQIEILTHGALKADLAPVRPQTKKRNPNAKRHAQQS
jgi:DNA-binding transcriptional regulator YdaS (Cro superfamily)